MRVNYLKSLILIVLILGIQANLMAQTSVLWGDLKPGEYPVGFKTIEKYDYSRTFRSKYDYFGELIPGENARPIQICIWYPAQKSDNDQSMVLGEYIFPIPENQDFFPYVTAAQQRELLQFMRLFGNNQALLLDASDIEMGAVRDAASAAGKFPLIVYFPDLTNGIEDNLVLCEYLASNGFVIVTTHQVGTAEFNPSADQSDIETMIRDKEFALAQIRDFEFINFDNIGVFGNGAGGLLALLAQMRNFDISAVASLAGWSIDAERFELAQQNAFFNPNRMDRPFLQFYDENEMSNLALIDSLKYSDRYLLKFEGSQNIDFTSYPSIQSYVDTLNIAKNISRPTYNLACHYLLDFYNLFLKNKKVELAFVGDASNPVKFELRKSMELPPNSTQFTAIIQNQGGVEAAKLFEKFEKTNPGSITLQEAAINMFGYQSLQRGQFDDALALFKLNADNFPNSANVWDSYSDGFQAIHDTANALRCYKKVLEILPVDSLIADQLRSTLKTNADSGIVRLSN